jgi:heme/copper-type cytochrome/quinol oxidase subunit 2
MKRRHLILDLLALGLLLAILVGVPFVILRFHVSTWDRNFSGRSIGIVARNDNIVKESGLWLVQESPLWDYGNKDRPTEIYVEAGEEVTLLLTSVDAIHEFSLAGYDLNSKVVPGKVTVVAFTADKSGEFKFECSSYCGEGHEGMIGKIIVTQDRRHMAEAH